MIVAVRRGNGYVFADLTANPYPFGTLPRAYDGKFALIVKDNGVEEITFPQTPTNASTRDIRIVGEVTDSGIFSGHYEELQTGADAAFMRSAFFSPLDSARRANLARVIANDYFEGADGDSLSAFNGKDYSAPVRATLRIRNAKVVTQAGNVLLLNNPLHPLLGNAREARDLEREPKRTLPIEIAKVVETTTRRIEVRMKLPSGWKAVLPKDISASGPLGSYEEHYSEVGDELVISKKTQGARGELPADRLPEVIAWLKMLGNEDSKLIVLQKQ